MKYHKIASIKTQHVPVLLQEVCSEIEVTKNNFIIDCTLGLGGHSKKLIENNSEINLICLDLYKKSIFFFEKYLLENGFEKRTENEFLYKNNSKLVYLVNENFANLELVLNKLKIEGECVILADLGLSTFQIKNSKRGFSFSKINENLDMRISLKNKVKAYNLINFLSEVELYQLFKNYGESEFSRIASKRIVEFRKIKQIKTVGDFLNAIKLKKVHTKIHPATKLFMALRIAVNRESENLSSLLNTFLKINSRKILLITFHSLEANSVKSFAIANKLKIKEILPSAQEKINNKSSRSSKLYVLQK